MIIFKVFDEFVWLKIFFLLYQLKFFLSPFFLFFPGLPFLGIGLNF